MAKMKAGNLTGIGNHNQRKTEKHSNPDIDIERSHLNYDLVNRTENYKTDIENYINENKSTSRAVRKDAVLINEWIITSDQNFFKDLSPDRTKEFFEVAKDYFAENFGDENIRYAQVHLDETTPHMHLGIVPFDKDNKLSAKRVFDRKTLKKIQDELPKYLKEHDFDLIRGEKGSERKHLSVPEYKQAQAKIDELNKSYETQKQKVIDVFEQTPEKISSKEFQIYHEMKDVEVETGEKNFLGQPKMKVEKQKTGNVVMPLKKYRELQKIAEKNIEIEKQVNAFMKTNLVEKNREYAQMVNKNAEIARDALSELEKRYDEIDHLKAENLSLKDEINKIYVEIKEVLIQKLELPQFLHEIFSNLKERFENSQFVNLFVQDKREEMKKIEREIDSDPTKSELDKRTEKLRAKEDLKFSVSSLKEQAKTKNKQQKPKIKRSKGMSR